MLPAGPCPRSSFFHSSSLPLFFFLFLPHSPLLTMVRYVPFSEPIPSCKPTPRPPLTAEEREKYNAVLEHVKSITELPVAENSKEKAPLCDEELAWLTKECILRYLRATKWKESDAKKRIEGSIVWRREYGVRKLTADYISPEARLSLYIVLPQLFSYSWLFFTDICFLCFFRTPLASKLS